MSNHIPFEHLPLAPDANDYLISPLPGRRNAIDDAEYRHAYGRAIASLNKSGLRYNPAFIVVLR